MPFNSLLLTQAPMMLIVLKIYISQRQWLRCLALYKRVGYIEVLVREGAVKKEENLLDL